MYIEQACLELHSSASKERALLLMSSRFYLLGWNGDREKPQGMQEVSTVTLTYFHKIYPTVFDYLDLKSVVLPNSCCIVNYGTCNCNNFNTLYTFNSQIIRAALRLGHSVSFLEVVNKWLIWLTKVYFRIGSVACRIESIWIKNCKWKNFTMQIEWGISMLHSIDPVSLF